MTLVTDYDALVAAATTFKTTAEAMDASTALKGQNRDLAVRLAYSVEAAIKNDGALVRARANQAGQ